MGVTVRHGYVRHGYEESPANDQAIYGPSLAAYQGLAALLGISSFDDWEMQEITETTYGGAAGRISDQQPVLVSTAAQAAHREALLAMQNVTAEEATRELPPPVIDRARLSMPEIMKALWHNSVEEVSDVLQTNPEAAVEPFMDHDFETPIMYAQRMRCSSSIIQLLIANGASDETIEIRSQEQEVTPSVTSPMMEALPSWFATFPMTPFMTSMEYQAFVQQISQ